MKSNISRIQEGFGFGRKPYTGKRLNAVLVASRMSRIGWQKLVLRSWWRASAEKKLMESCSLS